MLFLLFFSALYAFLLFLTFFWLPYFIILYTPTVSLFSGYLVTIVCLIHLLKHNGYVSTFTIYVTFKK